MMNQTKTVAAHTLGCKVNHCDTEAMLTLFEQAGYTVMDFADKADIYIINTCTVTNLGNKKSRQMLRKAKSQNPHALLVATGCYAQVAPEEVKAIAGVDLVLGTKNRQDIVAEVEACLGNRDGDSETLCHIHSLSDTRDFESLTVSKTDGRTRAYLKIQEGCTQFCSYCIIPYARGPIRSRKPEDVLAQATLFAQQGYKEIVLSGIHVASYGKDLTDMHLADILEQVHNVAGIERLRLSSLEPMLITPDFVARIQQLPKLCNHFHLSLQSGCGRTLKAMNRKYSPQQYLDAVALLRSAFPHVAITTDMIVGFPGESDSDFEESLAFAETFAPAKMHVFPFSPKTGTPAATFDGQIPAQVKEARAKKMLALGQKLSQSFMEQLIGTTVDVLFEQETSTPGIFEGHTTHYVKVQTPFPEGTDPVNQTKTVEIIGITEDVALSRLVL